MTRAGQGEATGTEDSTDDSMGAPQAGAAGPTPDAVLDCTGLVCPLPVLKARKRLRDLAPGQVLEVTATDKAARKDFAAWARETGNPLIASTENGGVYRFLIRRA
ncbi:MAG: hypothetical protein RLY86_360 [Pseudomonadota bacterium]